jgi:hypothetical protein
MLLALLVMHSKVLSGSETLTLRYCCVLTHWQAALIMRRYVYSLLLTAFYILIFASLHSTTATLPVIHSFNKQNIFRSILELVSLQLLAVDVTVTRHHVSLPRCAGV